jgi:xanthine dehydrogenase accessory factor
VVALTHDPKLDDPGLWAALNSDAFYIGALGSRTTHSKRLERLRAKGYGESQLQRIRGPIGLDIGARSPAEIAVAVLAQMTAELRKP